MIMNNEKKLAYDGHCAFAMSTGKVDVKGGNHQIEIDGRTFRFSNPVAKILFKILPNRIAKADQIWNKEH